MGCLEDAVNVALGNLQEFLDSLECSIFVESKEDGKEGVVICSVSRDGILGIEGIVVKTPNGNVFVSPEEMPEKDLKEAEIYCLTELKATIEKLKKKRK